MKTYSGKIVEGRIINFRCLTKEENSNYDDGSTIKIGTLPGSGDIVSSRLSEYYVAHIHNNGEDYCAVIHADDIISGLSDRAKIRRGYRMDSLQLFFKTDKRWYKWNNDPETDEGVTEIEKLVFDHLIGDIDIDKKIEQACHELVTLQRIPKTPATELFAEIPEENDRDYADRIAIMAANYQLLKQAKTEILLETYHTI